MEVDEGSAAQTYADTELIIAFYVGSDLVFLPPFFYGSIPTNEPMIPGIIVRTYNAIRSCESPKRVPLPNRRNVIMG